MPERQENLGSYGAELVVGGYTLGNLALMKAGDPLDTLLIGSGDRVTTNDSLKRAGRSRTSLIQAVFICF